MASTTSDKPHVFDERMERAIASGSRVTDVRIWPRNPNLREVRADALIVARLSEEDLKRVGDVAGVPVADIAIALRACVERDKARRMAMTLLARRDFSIAALHERLVKRGLDSSDAEVVTTELAAEGWLDDARLARTLVESAIERGKATQPALAKILANAQIEPSTADQAVKNALSEVDQQAIARELAEQRLARNPDGDPAARARRVANFLARRGFDEDTIRDAVAACGIEID